MIGYVSIYDSYVYMFINVRFFLAYVTIFLGFCSHITSVWFTFCAFYLLYVLVLNVSMLYMKYFHASIPGTMLRKKSNIDQSNFVT